MAVRKEDVHATSVACFPKPERVIGAVVPTVHVQRGLAGVLDAFSHPKIRRSDHQLVRIITKHVVHAVIAPETPLVPDPESLCSLILVSAIVFSWAHERI